MSEPKVLFKSDGTYLKSAFSATPGRLEIAADRIVFIRISPLFRMFGLVGYFLSRNSKGTVALTIEYANLKEFERQRHGLTTHVLNFKLNDGSSHRLLIGKFDAFVDMLSQQLSSQYGLTSVGENRWKVGEGGSRG